MNVKGKTVLVTGGSQGLGEQLCRELAEAGMKVIVNCAHHAERARKIAEEIGGCAMVFDIADPEEVRNAFAEIRELHVLINNARLDPYKRPSSMSDAEWFDRMIGVNLKGPYLCSLAAAEKMKNGGKIVNLSSVWAYRAATRKMMEYEQSGSAQSLPDSCRSSRSGNPGQHGCSGHDRVEGDDGTSDSAGVGSTPENNPSETGRMRIRDLHGGPFPAGKRLYHR